MKVSCVMAKMAGIESTAKTTSVTSMQSRTAKSGVTARTPLWRTKNFWPWNSLVTGIKRRSNLSAMFFSGSIDSWSPIAILMPVKMSSAAKT